MGLVFHYQLKVLLSLLVATMLFLFFDFFTYAHANSKCLVKFSSFLAFSPR